MSLVLGAEQGPKADPTTTTYTPRPDWYFFFLFEVLRVIKPPELVPLATIGIPTIAMILLLPPAVLRPRSRAPPGAQPDRHDRAGLTIVAMAYLTYEGANAGPPTTIDLKVPPQYEAGKLVVAQSGCLACHKIGDNGNGTLGPNLTQHRRRASRGTRSCARSRRARASCPPSRASGRRSSTRSPTSSPI